MWINISNSLCKTGIHFLLLLKSHSAQWPFLCARMCVRPWLSIMLEYPFNSCSQWKYSWLTLIDTEVQMDVWCIEDITTFILWGGWWRESSYRIAAPKSGLRCSHRAVGARVNFLHSWAAKAWKTAVQRGVLLRQRHPAGRWKDPLTRWRHPQAY